MDGGARTRRVRVEVEALEELLGFFEPPLSDAQVRQSNERTGTERALAEAPEADRLREGGLGLGPASGGGEDAAVVRVAERRHGRQVASRCDRLPDPDPLVGPTHVVGVLAGREQLTEDLL